MPKAAVQKQFQTLLSAPVKLSQPISICGCGPFTNYQSPQVSLHVHLNSVLTCDPHNDLHVSDISVSQVGLGGGGGGKYIQSHK